MQWLVKETLGSSKNDVTVGRNNIKGVTHISNPAWRHFRVILVEISYLISKVLMRSIVAFCCRRWRGRHDGDPQVTVVTKEGSATKFWSHYCWQKQTRRSLGFTQFGMFSSFSHAIFTMIPGFQTELRSCLFSLCWQLRRK